MNNIKLPKVILITQAELVRYAGSEIVTLELAEFFSQQGSQVHILSNWISSPIKKEFLKLKNVTLHTSAQEINFDSIELAWLQHNLIPIEMIEKAINGKMKTKVVFHHMSSILPIEFPFFPSLEKKISDLILFNSQLTKEVILTKTKDIKISGRVFNNPSPSTFKIKRLVSNKKPQKILVVSNHAPKEIIEATKIMRRKGLIINFMGDSANHDYRRVTPKDIVSSDVVITIGKTAQYALQSATPVYCYDHFGGPGYLTRKNFERASWFGFSGKGFSKKSPKLIVKNILKQYFKAQTEAMYLEKKYAHNYLLSNKIDMVLKLIEKAKKNKNKRIIPSELESFRAINNVYQSYYVGYKQAKEHSRNLELHVQNLEQEIYYIKRSLSWSLTAPLRQLKGATLAVKALIKK